MPHRPAIEKQSRDAKKREKPARSAASDRQIRESKSVSFTSLELICAGAVFLVALILYSWTLAPTVTLTDSGELIVVAQGLGVAHPPGFPLWVMLAHLASLVPLGNVAARINFSSAVFAALASAMMALTVADLIITASHSAPSKKKTAQQKKSNGDS